MCIRGFSVVLLLIAALSLHSVQSCGEGGIALEFRATTSSHRLQVNSVGHDLMFLMVNGNGYQVSRIPNVAVTLVQKSERSAVMRADSGATLSVSVVTDTAALYLVKVSWTNLNGELWDCKELSTRRDHCNCCSNLNKKIYLIFPCRSQ